MESRKMNLQLFAEGGNASPEGGQQQSGGQTPAGQTQPTDFDELLRTNTAFKAEFDRRINAARQKTGEDQKTSEALSKKVDALQAQVTGYQRRELAAAAQVDPKFTDYVIYKVEQGMTEGGDFGEALAAFMKDNAQYLTQAEAAQPTGSKANIGAKTSTPPAAASGVEAAFQALNPGMKID